MINNSYIYNGKVVHKRFKPKKHYFKYNVFSLFLDLSELNIIAKEIKFFSYNKFNLISFYDCDHGPLDGSSIEAWVKKKLETIGILNKKIKIKLLCYPRIFGYVFNPLSVFFVYDENSEIISILYEVKNTFGEQHTYVFKINKKNINIIENYCKKKFYVSPFIDMQCNYFFKVLKPNNKISVSIFQNDALGKLLYAHQDGERKQLSNKNLIFSYISHPLMTFKVIGAIHFEALKLWLKGVKLVKKKIKIKKNITFEN